jgi:hypothetical protein
MKMARLTDEEILATSNIGTDPAHRKATFEDQVRRDVEAFLARGGVVEELKAPEIPRPNTANP